MSDIERDEPLKIGGSLVTRFVGLCKSLKEARKSLPDLTQEQYDAIQDGRAELVGWSDTGLTYQECEPAPQANRHPLSTKS